MAKDILGMYGPESMPDRRAYCGGVRMEDKKDVMNYSPPKGPTNQMRAAPGLGGVNYGNGQRPVAQRQTRQGPGVMSRGSGGENRGSKNRP